MSSIHARASKGSVSVKAMVAVFSAGVLAGVVAVLPLIIPEQEPSRQTVAAASTDGRAPAAEEPAAEEPAADPCAGQTWPYLDSACADAKAKEQNTRQVRVISTDRAAPTTLATRTPRIEPKPVKPEPAPPPPAPAAETVTAPTAPTAPPEPVAEVKQAVSTPVAEPTEPKAADETPLKAAVLPPPNRQGAVLPAQEPGAPASEPAPRKTKSVSVSSDKRTAKRSKPVHDQPAAEQGRDPVRELARGRTQPVADPGNSLGGPTVVRTYEYADGRRVTVYQRADRGAASGQAMAYGNEQRSTRRMLVPVDDD